MVLPAILNPFIEGAPACVMTRIALDWIIEATPFDQLFEEVAEDQYTREFTLAHFVQVMLDVASGHRRSTRRSGGDSSMPSPRSRPSTGSSVAWNQPSPPKSSAERRNEAAT